MTLEGLDAPSALGTRVRQTTGRAELPHLDRLVETTADKVSAVGRECYAVDTILVAIRAFQALKQVALVNVPDANALVE